MEKNVLHIQALSFDGPKVSAFLQGQFINEILSLSPGDAHLDAYCLATGEVVAVFILQCLSPTHYCAWLPIGMGEILQQSLSRVARFSRVQITPLESTPHLPTFSFNHQTITPPNCSTDFYQMLIAHRIPWLSPPCSATWRPHDLSLVDHHAVSFDKGCFCGQEIIARMHYRGTPKYGLYHTTLDEPLLWEPGNTIHSAGMCILKNPENQDALFVLKHQWAKKNPQWIDLQRDTLTVMGQ